jgi:hypothetical protein
LYNAHIGEHEMKLTNGTRIKFSAWAIAVAQDFGDYRETTKAHRGMIIDADAENYLILLDRDNRPSIVPFNYVEACE